MEIPQEIQDILKQKLFEQHKESYARGKLDSLKVLRNTLQEMEPSFCTYNNILGLLRELILQMGGEHELS